MHFKFNSSIARFETNKPNLLIIVDFENRSLVLWTTYPLFGDFSNSFFLRDNPSDFSFTHPGCWQLLLSEPLYSLLCSALLLRAIILPWQVQPYKNHFCGFLVSLGSLLLLFVDCCSPVFSLDILNFAWIGQWCFSITHLRQNTISNYKMFFKIPITKHTVMYTSVSKFSISCLYINSAIFF